MGDGARGRVAEIQFEDEGGETVGVRPVTVRFLERFTGHALGRSAYSESSLFRKLFWLLVFLIAFGYMTFGFVDIISAYMSGPTTTTTQIVSRDELPFPAVTVCTQKLQPYRLRYDFSGLFSPMQKLLEMDAYLDLVFDFLSRPDDVNQPTGAPLPSFLQEENS
ncbi:unnamed protein product, partial [Darwinula stevensoni]